MIDQLAKKWRKVCNAYHARGSYQGMNFAQHVGVLLDLAGADREDQSAVLIGQASFRVFRTNANAGALSSFQSGSRLG